MSQECVRAINSSIVQAGGEHKHEAVPALSLNSEGFVLPKLPGIESSTAPCVTTFAVTMEIQLRFPAPAATAQDTVKGQQGLPAPFTSARPSSLLQRGARAQHGPGSVFANKAVVLRLVTHPCPRCSMRLELVFQPAVAPQGVQAAVRAAPVLGFRRRGPAGAPL